MLLKEQHQFYSLIYLFCHSGSKKNKAYCETNYNVSLLQLSHEAGQIVMDDQVLREDRRCHSSLHAGPVGNGQTTSLQTPHTPDIICSNCCPQAGVTEHYLLKTTAFKAVSGDMHIALPLP